MTCTCSPTAGFAARHFDEKWARVELRTYHRNGPRPTTRLLLNGLREVGANRGAVLDIGAGIGVLAFELLKTGVHQALCVDLSPASLAVGREEAERQGFADRITMREADFVAVAPELAPADIVTKGCSSRTALIDRGGQMQRPPSTSSATPVMNSASSEAR